MRATSAQSSKPRPRTAPTTSSSVLRFTLFAAPPALFVTLVTLAAFVPACGPSTPDPSSGAAGDGWAGVARDTTITHEACDPAGRVVKTFKGESDLTAGKLYVTRVYESNREVCSYADLNGDGNVDIFRYYGPDGKLRRHETSHSASKQIDEIAVYQAGELQVVMRETNFDGKFDTWDYYDGGKLVRRERDKTGDGRIDEWWEFEPGTDNATIVQADAKTGKPDPTQTVKIGLGAAAAPAAKGDAGVDSGDSGKPALAPEPFATPADAGMAGKGTPDTGPRDTGTPDTGKKKGAK